MCMACKHTKCDACYDSEKYEKVWQEEKAKPDEQAKLDEQAKVEKKKPYVPYNTVLFLLLIGSSNKKGLGGNERGWSEEGRG